MNLQFYLEKLKSSKIFKDFLKKNPNAYFYSGFFILNLGQSNDEQHFDFYLPKKKKRISFQLKQEIKQTTLDDLGEPVPERVSEDYNFDFGKITKLIENEMRKKNVKNKIQKILMSLQKFKGKSLLLCTIFISGLGLLKVNIDFENMKIISFEKKSFLDMFKIIRK